MAWPYENVSSLPAATGMVVRISKRPLLWTHAHDELGESEWLVRSAKGANTPCVSPPGSNLTLILREAMMERAHR